MKNWIKHSLLYLAVERLIKFYKSPGLQRMLAAFDKYYENSLLYYLLDGRAGIAPKSPAYRHSFSFRLLKALWRAVDGMIGKLHGFILRQVNYSLIIKVFLHLKHECSKAWYMPVAALIFGIAAGFGLTATIRASWDAVSIVSFFALLAAAVLLLAVKDGWKRLVQDSTVYKLCKYFLAERVV